MILLIQYGVNDNKTVIFKKAALGFIGNFTKGVKNFVQLNGIGRRLNCHICNFP